MSSQPPTGPSDDVGDRPPNSEQTQSPRRSQREQGELLERLQLQFERMPIAGIIFDAQYRIIEWNTAAEQIFGWRREEVVGEEGPLILLGRAARPPLAELLHRLSAGDMSAHSLNENVTKDGSVITCEWHNTPLRDADGVVTGIMSMAQDVTERNRTQERLRASEEMLRLASGAVAAFLFEWDFATNRVHWFGGLEEVLGFPLGDLTPSVQWYESRVHPDDRAPAWALVREALESGAPTYVNSYRFRNKDGDYVDVLDRARIVRDDAGQPIRALGGVMDVSEQRHFERELKRSNAELDQFASIVSHDLQEPLRTIGIYTQLLAERYRGQLDDRADRWTGHILEAVERMRSMVNGLLMVARLRANGDQLTPADTAAIVSGVWERLAEQRSGFEAKLTAGALPTLVADPAQLEQLFQNLLGNAIKYRRPSSSLTVEVWAERTEESGEPMWRFIVRDNGIGLDMTHAARIFDIFYRAHRRDRYEGVGIGLAICKKIVERHGGQISVESTPGEGAAFQFTLLERAK